MKPIVLFAACFVCTGLMLGCSEQGTPPTATQTQSSSGPSAEGEQFLLAAEPAGVNDVIKVRKEAQDGDDVVIMGRIGGSENPWIDGRAAFSIVDLSLKACSDIPGDTCPVPWDYCCETPQLPEATALVKVVDDGGDIVKADARELLGVKELSTVVINGKAQRDDAGNLTVLAKGVFIKQQ